MTAPISLCVITRDDSHLDACLASVASWVEEICIVCTSAADTSAKAIAEKHKAKFVVDETCNDAEGRMADFAKARNASFAMATQPWVLWLDSDDVVAGADKLEILCRAPEGTGYLLPYEYAYDDQGRVITRQYRERLIHGKDRVQWLYPVHEVLVRKTPDSVQFARTDEVTIRHQRQYHPKPTEPQRNLRILRDWMAKHPDDVRNQYYYGLELTNAGEMDAGIAELNRYLKNSGWADERAMAYYQLARVHEGRREYDKGLDAAFGSLRTVDWFESYYAICRMFYRLGQWERCIHYGDIALSLPPTKTFLFVNDADRHDIHTLLTVAKNATGDVKGALAHCEEGLKGNPSEPNLLHNRPLLERALRPEPEPRPVTAGGTGKLEIVFATWLGCERWDPSTLALGGLGGSETMLAHMARELAQLGHRVTVYADPPSDGTFDGVDYRSVRAFGGQSCDVLVVSRYANLLEAGYGVSAKIRWLWCHDVIAHQATPERLAKADRVLALSEWHKGNLIAAHGLDPRKVWVTRNGIDLRRFRAQDLVRYPRVINSSSPDRGWQVLLEEWPHIRQEVPLANLHLYYGFENWKAMSPTHPDIGRLESMAKNTPGVHYHGRVNQDELALAMLQATLWAHPTWFSETSCITAMEAKAAGLRIVTSNLAALKETAKGGVLIDGEWTSPEYRARFRDACVEALTAGPRDWEDAGANDIVTLAKEWEEKMRQELGRSAVLGPYEPTAPYRAQASL